jgi:uncharacterized RDD family membrane protein YckC
MKTIQFTTSQFVPIEYELASPAIRVLASLLDLFFLVIYFALASYFMASNAFDFDTDSFTVFSVFLIRLPWFLYSPVMEYLTNGRSLGKLILGIRVVKSNGESAGLREYFTRWIFRVVDIWIGGFGFLAVIVASTGEKKQRIGDIMADTVVVKMRNSQRFDLSYLLQLKSSENHEVSYPNVTRFSDEDLLLIKNALIRYKKEASENNKQLVIDLANETAKQLELPETPPKKIEFLKTVLQDYIVLTR